MLVAMMDVRVMGMGMPHRRVEVRVAVGFPCGVVGTMRVLMMLVVDVAVVVKHFFVFVHVFVALRQVEPHTYTHERGRRQKDERDCPLEDEQGQSRPDEGRQREIGPGASRSKVTQRQDEARQAHPVPQQSDCRCRHNC